MRLGGNWWWQNSVVVLVNREILVDSTSHLHSVQNVSYPVSPDNTSHLHTAGEPTSATRPANTSHLHTAENVDVGIIKINNTSHLHTADNVAKSATPIHSCEHINETDYVQITLVVEDSYHLHSVQNTPVIMNVEDSVHLHNSSNAPVGIIKVSYTEHNHIAELAEISSFFRFATRYGTPNIISDIPITYVELAKSELLLNPSSPNPGVYDEVLIGHPVVSSETSDSIFGIRTLADTELQIDNKNQIFTVDDGVEFGGFTAQVWERKSGVNRKLYRGRVAGLKIDKITSIRLKDTIKLAFDENLPKRFITTTMFPKAKDVGKVLNIATGRVSRLICPNIEWDDVNRIYRYAAGEGLGYGDAGWDTVYNAYHSDLLFKTTTGTVVSATSNSIRLELADKRPADYYKWQWVAVAAQEPRYCTTNDADTDVFVTPSFSPTPSPGQIYTISPHRFYDGTQDSPYSGIAFLEFKFPIMDGNTLEMVYVDANALQGEINYVRFIQSLLSNPTWGMGMDVDTSSFNTAAALADITPLLCEYGISSQRKVIDIITDISQVRGIWLHGD